MLPALAPDPMGRATTPSDEAPAPPPARFATGMDLAMRIVQWLGRPAADFVYAATW
jgi:hypothetical protein